ncbi:MAG: sporulation protein YqfD [Clostridia bacterium]|nr:sporulation protein YqfD [Clostridia bacterium]
MIEKFMGSCIYKIKGLNSERLINACLKDNIEILLLDKNNDNMLIECRWSQQKLIKKVLNNYEILSTEYKGLCSLVYFLKKRFAFLIGLALSIILLILWQTHLWTFEITGLERLNKSEITKFLNEKGFFVGASLNGLDTEELSNALINEFDELSFVSIMQVGSSLVINVKEKTYDENLDESLMLPIVASFDGVVSKVDVYQGTALVKAGDVVKKGQVLIAPFVIVDDEQKPIRARGNVEAQVFVKGQVLFNENQKQKVRSGKVAVKRSLNLFGMDFPTSSEEIKFKEYEIEKSSKIICKNMPICFKIVEEKYYEIIETDVATNFEDEKELLIAKSRYLAYENLEASFEVESEQTDIVIAGDNYYITTYIKVNTNIGVTDYESNI